VMSIYLGQTEAHRRWAPSAPTVYTLLEKARVLPITQTLTLMALILAAIIVSIWIFLAWKKQERDTPGSIVLTALASVALTTFVLPQMHQRYFYPQDLIALVVAFYRPKLWFLPLLSQIISTIAYGPYLFNIDYFSLFGSHLDTILYLAFPAEVLLLAIVLWQQFRSPPIDDSQDLVEMQANA
jgi:hypothetical protein